MADLPQPTVFDLAVMASPAYQQAQQAADDFAAGMERLVTQAAESPESVERLRAAVERMAEGGPCESPPGAPHGAFREARAREAAYMAWLDVAGPQVAAELTEELIPADLRAAGMRFEWTEQR